MARHSTPNNAGNQRLKRHKNGDSVSNRQPLAGQCGKGIADTGHLPQKTSVSD
jgi:hypothetical protein